MGVPKCSWLSAVESAAARHSLPCISEGIRDAIEARHADCVYDGDDDENSINWARVAVQSYESARAKLCTAWRASGCCYRGLSDDIYACAAECQKRAKEIEAELAKHGKKGDKKCTCGHCSPKKDDEKKKCTCSVCDPPAMATTTCCTVVHCVTPQRMVCWSGHYGGWYHHGHNHGW